MDFHGMILESKNIAEEHTFQIGTSTALFLIQINKSQLFLNELVPELSV
jgi:hypothetical protein